MLNVKKILLPSDLSESSRTGLRFAFALAAEYRSELLVLHVARSFPVWEIPDETGFLDPAIFSSERERALAKATQDLVRFLRFQRNELQSFTLRYKVVFGPIAERIVEEACREEVDLILVSPKPRGSLMRYLSGSITDRVTREAPCPVLSVCPPLIIRPRHGTTVPFLGETLQGSHA
jgi:nucleotide-binding universal stress UspA family protein